MSEQPKSGKLRIKQYQKYLDSTGRFEIAFKIVQTKAEHSLNLLEGLSKFYESIDFVKIRKSVEKEDLILLDIMKNSETQDISKSIKQLMTYEGRIAGIYLENLTVIFHKLYPEFHFTGRKNKSNSRNYNASLYFVYNHKFTPSCSSLWFCSKHPAAARTAPAIPIREDVACRASLLPYAISCMWHWRFCNLVSVACSLAWHDDDEINPKLMINESAFDLTMHLI